MQIPDLWERQEEDDEVQGKADSQGHIEHRLQIEAATVESSDNFRLECVRHLVALENVRRAYGYSPGEGGSDQAGGDDAEGPEFENATVEEQDRHSNEGDGDYIGDDGSEQHLESVNRGAAGEAATRRSST